MNISITGASGHVGTNLCRELIRQNHKLKVLVHHFSKSLDGLDLQIIKGSLLDMDALHSLVEDSEIVIHLAAAISIDGESGNGVVETNINGTRNILDAVKKCRTVKRFIHFSSIHALINEPLDKPLDEFRGLAINDPVLYNHTKAMGEAMVLEEAKNGLDALIINPTSVVGPNDFMPSLVGQALIRIANNKLPALVPGGYDWVDVRDVVAGTIAAIEKGRSGESYLLSGHWESLSSMNRLIKVFHPETKILSVMPFWLARMGVPFLKLWARITGSQPLYTNESIEILKTGHRQITSAKAEKELGYHSRPFKDTLKDTLEWFTNNGYLKK